MYFYIYVHLDKAKIATLASLKSSPDVIKGDKSRRLNVERNIIMLKTARFRSRVGNQNRSRFTYNKREYFASCGVKYEQ